MVSDGIYTHYRRGEPIYVLGNKYTYLSGARKTYTISPFISDSLPSIYTMTIPKEFL